MVQFPSGFIITSNESVDCRLVLTAEEMLAISMSIRGDEPSEDPIDVGDYNMPDRYFCVNSDDGRIYYFYCEDPEDDEKHNDWQDATGYFKVSEYRLDEALAEEIIRAKASEQDIDERALHKSFIGEPVVEEVEGDKVWLGDQEYHGDLTLNGTDITGVANLEADAATIGVANVDEATIETANVATADIGALESAHATLDEAEITSSTVQSETVNVLMASQAAIENADIDAADVNELNVTVKSTIKEAEITDNLSVGAESHLAKDVAIGENKIILDADSGDIHADGKAMIEGGLEVDDNVDIAGDATIAGALDVKQKATLDNELEVKENTTLDKDLLIKEDATVEGNLSVTGTTVLANDLTVNANEAVNGDVHVTGTIESTGNILTDSDLYVKAQKADANEELALKIGADGKVVSEDYENATASPIATDSATFNYVDKVSANKAGKIIENTSKTVTVAEGDNQGQFKLNTVNVNINNLGADDKPTFTGVTITAAPVADADATTKKYVDDVDKDLQEQIDAIESKSDVVDVVATKAELDDYDTSKLNENDVIKVLADETRGNAITYYRWLNGEWDFIGAIGPFYTKSETDTIIDSLDMAEVGENGSYLQKISESNGRISATLKDFDTAIDNTASDTTAPTTKATKDYVENTINGLEVTDITENLGVDKTIVALSETAGKISATAQPISIASSQVNDKTNGYDGDSELLVTGKAIKDAIDTLDADSVGSDGSYIKTISEGNGVISASVEAFDTAVTGVSTDDNAPTSKAVYDFVDTKSNVVHTTWAELKALRDNSELIPGRQYRITDYVCTVTG